MLELFLAHGQMGPPDISDCGGRLWTHMIQDDQGRAGLILGHTSIKIELVLEVQEKTEAGHTVYCPSPRHTCTSCPGEERHADRKLHP
jgi:hypothetical protein